MQLQKNESQCSVPEVDTNSQSAVASSSTAQEDTQTSTAVYA